MATKEYQMSPADLRAVHDELDRVRAGLDRCIVRSAAMADHPEEVPGLRATPVSRRLAAPPLHRGALPPTDED